jgi:predicted double-glycine peptidase
MKTFGLLGVNTSGSNHAFKIIAYSEQMKSKVGLLAICPILLFGASANPKTLDIPFVRQTKAACGSAAVAMVIQYWARQNPGLALAEADSERIDKYLPATSSKGIQGKALKAYLEEQGFQTFIFDGELADLQHHLEKGRPVIVCFAPKGPHGPLHYAVIAGVDEHSTWMNDPARGKLFREDLERFLVEWKATGDWALLAVPRSPQ